MSNETPRGHLADDTLVPIDGKRLSAALNHRGWSKRETVRRLLGLAEERNIAGGIATLDPQTLNRITADPQQPPRKGAKPKEPQRSCRESVLKGLVAIIDHPSVTEAWLKGEEGFRFVPRAGLINFSGRAWDPLAILGGMGTPVPLENQFVLDEFMLRCYDALIRDARQALGDQAAAEGWYESHGGWLVVASLVRLLKPEVWQATLVQVVGSDTRAHLPPADTTVSLTDAFTRVLAPWFDGHAELDLSAVCDLVEMHKRALWPMMFVEMPFGIELMRKMCKEPPAKGIAFQPPNEPNDGSDCSASNEGKRCPACSIGSLTRTSESTWSCDKCGLSQEG